MSIIFSQWDLKLNVIIPTLKVENSSSERLNNLFEFNSYLVTEFRIEVMHSFLQS